jgi:hypothetical protein
MKDGIEGEREECGYFRKAELNSEKRPFYAIAIY